MLTGEGGFLLMNNSEFKPCVIIPVYNHHHKIHQVIKTLSEYAIPCLLIDDGSDDDCARILQSIAETDFNIYLERLPVNSGKGAAVCKGLVIAFSQGYTHALQIDADGQHDLADVPKFLAAGLQHPDAVICGQRDYLSMPKRRRAGRKLTDFWVRVNTLSNSITDSMCGYRLYPLKSTIDLLNRFSIGSRMDFDTDILVKLYWVGHRVINIPTRIEYFDDVPSHFDLVKDNVRISWMHTRLFFGMLTRIVTLLKRF